MDLVYACHVKNNYWDKLINYNLSKLINHCNNIYIVYSISDGVNSDLFEKNIIYENVNFIKVDNEGYDFKKYKIGLLSMNIPSNYDWNIYLNRYPDLKTAFGDDIVEAEKHWFECGMVEGRSCQTDTNNSVILMNDSFILTRNIDDIINNIQKKISNNVKFIGLTRSDEIVKHYQSFFWVLNYNLIQILCDLLTPNRLDTSKGSNNIIMKCEVELSNLFINRYKSEFIYHANRDGILLNKLEKLLDNGYPIIKLKCLRRKKLCFFNSGMYNRLKYKYDQPTYIPEYMKKILDSTGLEYECIIK